MADDVIKIVITRQRFDEVISVEDSFHLNELKASEIYDYLCQFVIGADGEYLPAEEARKLFKKIPRGQFSDYISAFYRAITDAFVNPTSAGS